MQSEVTIEKGVVIPEVRGNSGKFRSVAINMEIGDSVKLDEQDFMSLCSAIRALGHKVTTRKLEEGVYRVWKKERRG